MNLEIVVKFIVFILSAGVVSSYKFKNSKGMLMDVDYLVSQLYLQHCTFVEVGEGICSLFVELPSDSRSRYKRSIKRQMYFGNCLCSEFRAWQLCSHHLSLQRPEDCVFEEGVSCPLTSARVHRRLCDVTGMSQWNTQCNCSVTLADMQQETLCGFRTCVVGPLPSAICSPRSVCGTAHCDTSLHGSLYSVKCNRKCKDRQPFCERTGPDTSVKRKVESEWTDWQPVSKCDKSSFQQSVAECLDCYGNPAFDCIGPGLLCCTNEEGDCICEVKLEEGHLNVYRYVITFSRSNDKNNNIIKVRSAGNKNHSNVWNRFIDIANHEDDSYSLFSKHKPKVYYMNINEKTLPAKNLVHNSSRNFEQNIVNVTTKAKSNRLITEASPLEAVTSGVKSLKSNVTSGVVDGSSDVKSNISMQVQPEKTLKTKEKSNFHYTQQPDKETSSKISEKEQFKKNQTFKTSVESQINNNNNTQNNSSQQAKVKNKSNREHLTKSEQKIKSKFDGKSKEKYYMENELYDGKKSRPGLTSNNEQLKKEEGNVHNVDGDKDSKEKDLKIINDKATASSQQTHTMGSADGLLTSSTLTAISSPNLLTDVDGSKNGTHELTEPIVEVTSECVKVFNHIAYNGSEDSVDDGSKLLATSNKHKTSKISETVIKNNQSDEKVKNNEESEWTITEKTLLTSRNVSTTKNEIIMTTQQTVVVEPNIRNSSTDSTVTDNCTNPTPHPKLNTSNVGKVDSDKMEKILSFASKGVLYDQNDPIQILKSLNPVLPGETKDLNNNAYDEPEPVLKDLDKDTMDDNMYDELNDILSYKHNDVQKENKGREINSRTSEDRVLEKEHKDKHVTESFKSTHNKLKSKLFSDI